MLVSKDYWAEYGTRKIQRANLDGSNVESLITSGLWDPKGLALDLAGGKMYWVDQGSRRIRRANLDGSNVENLITGLSSPEGLDLDVASGKIYWTDQRRQDPEGHLDGSEIEDLVTAGLNWTRDLMLLDSAD